MDWGDVDSEGGDATTEAAAKFDGKLLPPPAKLPSHFTVVAYFFRLIKTTLFASRQCSTDGDSLYGLYVNIMTFKTRGTVN